MNAHDFEFPGIEGETIYLGAYAGRVILLVNTASACDTTPQYAGLQTLHERYGSRGLTVLAVPSNDFGQQEPDDNDTIRRFCETRYGVTFLLAAKQKVAPPGEHPFYARIREEIGEAAQPEWNFHKYLIGVDGELLQVWDSRTWPTSGEITGEIEAALPD